MLSPLPRRSGWAYCFAHSPSRISLPRKGYRVGLRIGIFEACSAFTHVTACTLAPSPIRDALYRRLQLLRCLHSCSGCFRLERSPGGTCTHWKAPPFHGAHPELPSAPPGFCNALILSTGANRSTEFMECARLRRCQLMFADLMMGVHRAISLFTSAASGC